MSDKTNHYQELIVNAERRLCLMYGMTWQRARQATKATVTGLGDFSRDIQRDLAIGAQRAALVAAKGGMYC